MRPLLHVLIACALINEALTSRSKLRTARDPPSEDLEDVHTAAAKEIDKTLGTVAKMRDHKERAEQLEEGYTSYVRTFLPKFRFRLHIFVNTLALMVAAIICFAIYFNNVYEDDRSSSFKRWENKLKNFNIELNPDTGGLVKVGGDDTPRTLRNRAREISPDVMMQFHHPSFDAADKDTVATLPMMERLLVPNGPANHDVNDGVFTRFKKLRNISRLQGKSMSQRLTETIGVSRTTSTTLDGPNISEQAEMVTMGQAREAIMQDLFELIPTLGIDELMFSSIDNDELFVCLSLKQQEVIQNYLKRDYIHLHIQKAVVAKLGIAQPPEEPASLPPRVAYNPRTISNLHKTAIIDDCVDTCVYDVTMNKTGPTIIDSAHRIRIIVKELLLYFNLDSAVEDGLLLSWYPVHHNERCAELEAIWANFGNLKDFTFVQPLPFISSYFGASVAFISGWTGVYCKALLPLAFFAILYSLIMNVGEAMGYLRFSSNQVMGFTLVLCMWSRIAANLWEKEEAFFLKSWYLEDQHSERQVRAEFWGELLPAPKDTNLEEIQYPAWKYSLLMFVSNSLTLIACLLVMGFMFMWMSLFSGSMNIGSSIVLSLQIKIFELLFGKLVVVLCDMENHKYQHEYFNSYLKKYFVFQFVNNYSACFFLSANPHLGPGKESLFFLRQQLATAVIVLSLCSIAEVLISALQVKISLWWEHRQLEKEGKVPPWRCSAEAQGKYAEFKVREQIDKMLPLVLSLGHMLLFGAIAPIIIPFGCLVFVLHLRSCAYMLTFTTKRAYPQSSHGIGEWKAIIEFMMVVGVVYSAFLLVYYGESFEGSTVTGKMSGVVIFCVGVAIMWQIVSVCVKCTDPAIPLMEDRRKHVLHRLFLQDYKLPKEKHTPRDGCPVREQWVQAASDAQEQRSVPVPASASQPVLGARPRLLEEVVAGQWDQIPMLETMRDLKETY